MMIDWASHAFTMIAPDAIRRGLAETIVRYFGDAGLRPVSWAIGEVTPAQADAMHGKAVARSDQAYRYRCLDTLFALGPCVMLALRADSDEDRSGSVHERALLVRGASTAAEVEPGTIRHDLRALNRVLSLLHVSDGPAEAGTESAILIPGADASSPGRTATWRSASDLPDFLRMLSSGYAEDRDLAAVRRELRVAVASRTWSSLDARARSVTLSLLASGAGTEPDPLRESVAVRALCRAHPAAAVLPLSFEEPIDLQAVERRLAAVGIGLDDWQRAVLTTSMYFPPW